jgi:molybdenum cofactor biosynthesis enzyme MoaA
MKIQTLSVVVGGNKCNAKCPYCVSKMTGKSECSDKVEDINFRNFRKSIQFACESGVSTTLLTGKGEPLLYPAHITAYLDAMFHHFPLVELQTNGILLPEMKNKKYLETWYDLGLSTISLSCVHWQDDRNKEIFSEEYVSLEKNVKMLHDIGFSVRVACVMINNYIDTIGMVQAFVKKCKEWGVEQFTVRPATVAENNNSTVARWTKENTVKDLEYNKIVKFFEWWAKDPSSDVHLLLELAHGAKVYDYIGQNISINTCLTESPDPEDIRQLIFFPDGHLKFSWVHEGAIIL